MGLKDLKSDLTKAFKRIPAGGKLEKRVEGPQASNYSAKPKKYKIPNDGRGSQVRYNSSSGTYEAKSRFNDVQNTSQISGRHSSNIEPTKTNPTGRHDNVDIKLNELAPTPVKTAVEPIAMSATPVKQGLTPKLMSDPVEKVGTTPGRIPITGYVDNQSPNIDNSKYSMDVGEGTLFQMDGMSKFDISKLVDPYFNSGMIESKYFVTRNNVDILKLSDFDLDKDAQPYAPSGYTIDRLSRYFTPIRDAIDLDKEFGIEKSNNMQLTGEFDSHNPSIQIHGSNITTPYDLDLESVLSSDSIFTESDVKSAYTDPSDEFGSTSLRFFTDHAKVDLDNMISNHSPTANNPNNGVFTLANQLNSIHSGFTGGNTIPVQYNLNYFGNSDGTVDSYYSSEILSEYDGSPSKLSSNGLNLGFDPEGVEGLNNSGGKNMLSLSDQLPGNGNDPNPLNMFFKHSGASMVTGTTNPFGNYDFSIPGFRATDNPNGGQNPTTTPATPGYNSDNTNNTHEGTDFLFLDIAGLTTGDFFAKGRIGFDSGASVFRTFDETQNFFNQDNPLMENGFNPQFNGKQLVLTGPSWDWSLGNTELTEFDWIQNDDDNPSIFSIAQNDPTVNYFDINNDYYQGYINYNNNGSYFAMTGGWNNWQHSDTVVSLFAGLNGTTYTNPSIYFEENNSTNYFDTDAKYTDQFTRNKSAYDGSTSETSDYVNVIDGAYNGLNISSTNSDYAFSSLFNNQLSYWGITDIEHLGDIDNTKYLSSGLHPDPDSAAGNSFSGYADESTGAFTHDINTDWSYYTMIGLDNSSWGSGIDNFRPDLTGGDPHIGAMIKNKMLYRYLDNGISSWMMTATELGGKEFESIDENLVFYHPDYNPTGIGQGISTYGYGLGYANHLRYWSNSILVGSGKFSKNIAWRNPMGQKHISYLEGDPLLISKKNNWLDAGYEWGPSMYGTKVGLSSGGIMGISTGRNPRAGDLWLNAFDLDNQVFDSSGAGISTMGGIGYEERMINIYNENTTSRSAVGSILNNLNPFDNIKSIVDQMSTAFDDTIKRWWMQHNRFAIQMSANPPKGSHQGLPGDSATGAVGRFSGMLNSVSTGGADLISTITGLSARKYWSVQSYPGLQISSEIVDTGITRFNDFRMFISDMGASHVGLSGPANYLANNIHKRYGYPSSGTPGLDRKMYYKHIPGMGDNITMENMWTGDQLPEFEDYIKFTLTDVVNSTHWRFRAYISGLTDSVQPQWSQYNYIGRPDPVFQYNGVSARNLSFNLKVAALAQQDMYWMWKKINKMIGMCYPSGYQNGGFMRGPMMKLTLGDYVVDSPCFMNALTVSVPDDSPWEINQMFGSAGPLDSLAGFAAAATNVVNDPVGSLVNTGAALLGASNTEDPVPARKNNKNYVFNQFDPDAPENSGQLLAQLPHIVDLSLGFTIIGNQDKSSTGLHLGHWNKDFFKGYDTTGTIGKEFAETKVGKALEFIGL